ncbi:hypothetical protein SGFS_065060 [Streptomyces graminofaciens]|uniref:Uncharacterized protein n=1 Tax=Streptomyces graminofaciens TaxID=68212 RepID=A0ABN5VQ11_9ACTN|nr:hypothetical protein [Streptomyces graminofaciens]BBC35212.1 hypothetical protein SGFS_065060 [Streptomyces graminofaciens]
MATVLQTPTEQFMAAYSTAEHVTAASPVAPDSVSLMPHQDWGYLPGTFQWRIGVQLHFADAGAVRRFAESLGVAVEERPHDERRVYVHADGVRGEVPFRAWALAAVESSAVAA